MFDFRVCFTMIDGEAVELVGKGVRGGKRVAFSTASSPVRRRRIVHKSIASRVSAHQHDTPWGHQARGRAGRDAPSLTLQPERLLGP